MTPPLPERIERAKENYRFAVLNRYQCMCDKTPCPVCVAFEETSAALAAAIRDALAEAVSGRNVEWARAVAVALDPRSGRRAPRALHDACDQEISRRAEAIDEGTLYGLRWLVYDARLGSRQLRAEEIRSTILILLGTRDYLR